MGEGLGAEALDDVALPVHERRRGDLRPLAHEHIRELRVERVKWTVPRDLRKGKRASEHGEDV